MPRYELSRIIYFDLIELDRMIKEISDKRREKDRSDEWKCNKLDKILDFFEDQASHQIPCKNMGCNNNVNKAQCQVICDNCIVKEQSLMTRKKRG